MMPMLMRGSNPGLGWVRYLIWVFVKYSMLWWPDETGRTSLGLLDMSSFS